MFSEEKTKELLNLISHSTEELITVKIPECESIKLCGSNYVDVIQGSKEWFTSRVGIITASKIPALLGLCGHKEFDSSWFCIHNKLDESGFPVGSEGLIYRCTLKLEVCVQARWFIMHAGAYPWVP